MAFSGVREDRAGCTLLLVRDALVAQGWRPLASDANPCYVALLLVSPDGRTVCKGARDEGWAKFIRWAHDNQHPNLPKVERVDDFTDDYGDVVTIAFMERLDPLPWKGHAGDYTPIDGISKALARVVRQAMQWTRATCSWRGNRSALRSGTFRALWDAMTEHMGDKPGDLHGYNLMLRTGPRGGATLVLIDPYAW